MYDPVWAAAQSNGLLVTFHTGMRSDVDPSGKPIHLPTLVKSRVEAMESADDKFAERTREQYSGRLVPEEVIIALVTSGVLERFPNLHFIAVEFNGHWLSSLMGAMDKAYTVGIGQDAGWRAGSYQHDRPSSDQPYMNTLFPQGMEWPYPLMPSEYVRRQIHVTFMDDPTAVACRHLTGVQTLLWGADYPHAEGTWPHSREALDQLFDGVPASERAAITGGTLSSLLGIELPKESQLVTS